MKVATYLGSLAQLCCGQGGRLQTNVTGERGERSRCLSLTGFEPLTDCVLSRSTLLRLQVALPEQSNCLLGQELSEELSEAGPGLRALPRSKPLRFSGTPQRCRLGWACVLCPSQV